MRKEHIALHITIFVQKSLYNIIVHIIPLIVCEIWSKGSNLASLLFVEVFAEVAEVKTEALNIKPCQPRPKDCRGKAEAECIFV